MTEINRPTIQLKPPAVTAIAPNHLYNYATNRDDLPVAVGKQDGTGVNGSFALFADAESAVLFMSAFVAVHPDYDWHNSPSVERLLAKTD